MLAEKLEQLLVRQIEREYYSSSLYLSMASWADRNGFPGVAEWMHLQSVEERDHMLKIISYVNSRDGKAIIPAIALPPAEFESVLDIFKQVKTHEEFISESLNEIVGVCLEVRDFMTNSWMQWFVNEQIQEEESVSCILDRLKLMGSEQLYQFDTEVVGMRDGAGN